MDILEKYGFGERYKNEAAAYPALLPARIISQNRNIYRLITSAGECTGAISGKLRFETDEIAKYPAVGDFVMISPENDGENAVIHHILPRRSVFMRKAVGVSGQAQVVAANTDILFICMSLNNNFNLSRLERYLSVAWDSGSKPVILLTKADLCSDISYYVSEAERVSMYSDVLTLSAFDGSVREKLSSFIHEGVTAAFIGSSGVGKSTIINILLGEDLMKTSYIGRDDKGRHTTTSREMFVCPQGGVLIDTPGMRELGAENVDLSKSFSDIDSLGEKCRFSDCTHTNEPGCAVLGALENGELDARRYENYIKLRNESGYEGLDSREIEMKKLSRMFKDVGGIKGARNITKNTLKK